jgi:hypothetical protein
MASGGGRLAPPLGLSGWGEGSLSGWGEAPQGPLRPGGPLLLLDVSFLGAKSR